MTKDNALMPACSGCGKTNTTDSQWACYCVGCWTKAQWTLEDMAYRPGELPADLEVVGADQAMTIALIWSEQEPVARIGMIDEDHFADVCRKAAGDSNTPLYTAPSKHEEQKFFKMGHDAAVLEIQLNQAEGRNFCPNCGKRLHGMEFPGGVHTCTPPAQGRMFDYTGKKIL